MQQKKIIILTTVVTAIIVSGIFYTWQRIQIAQVKQKAVAQQVAKPIVPEKKYDLEPTSDEPISYSTNGVPASIEQSWDSFNTADYLDLMASDACEKHDLVYLKSVAAKFDGATKYIYEFRYPGKAQGGAYIVTIMENKAGYKSIDQFESDFAICAAGSEEPEMLNNKWLLFERGCGGAGDTSGWIYGCDEIRKIIEPSLKLN